MGGEKSNNFLNTYGEAKAEPSVDMNSKGKNSAKEKENRKNEEH